MSSHGASAYTWIVVAIRRTAYVNVKCVHRISYFSRLTFLLVERQAYMQFHRNFKHTFQFDWSTWFRQTKRKENPQTSRNVLSEIQCDLFVSQKRSWTFIWSHRWVGGDGTVCCCVCDFFSPSVQQFFWFYFALPKIVLVAAAITKKHIFLLYSSWRFDFV